MAHNVYDLLSAASSKRSSKTISLLNYKPFTDRSFRGSKSDIELFSTHGISMKSISQSTDKTTSSSYTTDESSSLGSFDKYYYAHPTNSFPDDLHKTILDFVVAFMVEKPNDIIDYAVEHFTKIQGIRNGRQMLHEPSETDKTSEAESHIGMKNVRGRRCSVFGEHVDIEDEVYMDDAGIDLMGVIGKTNEQQTRLAKTLMGIFLFQNLSPEQIQQILDAMYPVRVCEGDILMSNETAATNNFYVIEVGDFEVYENGEIVDRLHNKGTIGEITLLHTVMNVPTVKAMTEGMVWAMDRKSFKNILQTHIYKQQKYFDELLRSVKMFEVLNQYERLKLVEALVSKTYCPGETIIKQGDEPDGMYFIEDGNCSVYLDRMNGKGEIIVNRLSKGNYFGELALLTHDKRKASVYAETTVKVAFIDKDSFERLLGKCVDLLNRGIEDYNLKDEKMVTYLAEQKEKAKEIQKEKSLVSTEPVLE